MILTALRTLWDEPRAAYPPTRVWRDWLLVGVVMVVVLLEGTLRAEVTWRPVVTLVTLGLAPVLLWRRTHPLVCVVVGSGTGAALGLAGQLAGMPGVGLNTMVFVLVFAYALVRWDSGRHIVVGMAVVALAATLSIATEGAAAEEFLGGLGVLAAAVAGGAASRYRAESRLRAFDQVRSQERVGLARELHDSVAHHVSAITLQAQAGRTLAQTRPEAALEALAVIETEASRTLAEMRAIVRVLRDGAPADYVPQPRVVDLVSLARRDPNPVIDVELVGELAGTQPHIDAAVYRMAQEAVTNALRHGRNASHVEVRVVEEAGRIRLRVRDDGQLDPARPTSPGFGLLGMTERVQLLGGTVSAGPLPEGGWVVEAELPTEVPR